MKQIYIIVNTTRLNLAPMILGGNTKQTPEDQAALYEMNVHSDMVWQQRRYCSAGAVLRGGERGHQHPHALEAPAEKYAVCAAVQKVSDKNIEFHTLSTLPWYTMLEEVS